MTVMYYLIIRSSDAESIVGCHITPVEVELILRHLKNTSPGTDNNPAWVAVAIVY